MRLSASACLPLPSFTRDSGEIINLRDLGLSYDSAYQGGFIYELTVSQVSIYPKLYLSSKKLFGTKNDTFNPYVGVGTNFITFNEKITAYQNKYPEYVSADNLGQWVTVPSEGLSRAECILAIAPAAGIEMNLSRSMSLFFESVFQPKKELPDQPSMWVAEMNYYTQPYMSGGIQLNAGLKYYFNLF